jgi:hypothetical protein
MRLTSAASQQQNAHARALRIRGGLGDNFTHDRARAAVAQHRESV